MPSFRRGSAAIQEAAEPTNTKAFVPFAPSIFWSGNDTDKFVLILTPIDEVARVELHAWIPTGEVKRGGQMKMNYEEFLSRKDPALAESYDRLEDELGRSPSTKIMGVGVELEPTYEVVKGRKRPTGFTTAVGSFTRRSDEDGEIEVEFPKIGIITQSSMLMWSPLNSLDQTQGPLEDLPLQIKREGVGTSTSYSIIPFVDAPVDLSGVVDGLDGISYLQDHTDEINAEIDSVDSDEAEEFGLLAAQVIARWLLDTRLAELADLGRYNELTENIRYLPKPFTAGRPKFGPPGTEGSNEGGEEEEVKAEALTPAKKARPARKPQRKKAAPKVPVEESEEDDGPDQEEPAPKAAPAEKKKSRFDELKEQIAKENAEQ